MPRKAAQNPARLGPRTPAAQDDNPTPGPSRTSKSNTESRCYATSDRGRPNRTKGRISIPSSIHIDHQPKGVHRFEWDRRTLQPYQRYSKLYGERKFSSEHPTMIFAFLDLPGEVRNKIYRFALLLEPAYVELSAKTAATGEDNKIAHRRHLSRFRKVRDSVGLLRVNKQIHREASPIYYGEHEWRFTNVKGAYVLDTFLQQIGKYNQSLLRKIAVHVPWRGWTTDNWRDDLPESGCRLEAMRASLERMGLRPSKKNWEFNKRRCLQRVIRTLERHGNLEQFSLIMPNRFYITEPLLKDRLFPHYYYNFVLNTAKFGGLQMRLVILHSVSDNLSIYVSYGPKRTYTHIAARMQAKRLGVTVIDTEYDDKGDWSLTPANYTPPAIDVDESYLKDEL